MHSERVHGRTIFVTGPEGSGTTILVTALTNHPAAVKGDLRQYGQLAFHAAAGAQVLPLAYMSTARPGRVDLEDLEGARHILQGNTARLFVTQPKTRVVFWKYSTPAARPKRWPVFQHFCDRRDSVCSSSGVDLRTRSTPRFVASIEGTRPRAWACLAPPPRTSGRSVTFGVSSGRSHTTDI